MRVYVQMPTVYSCDFLFQLTVGTQWMDSGIAMMTAVQTWCRRKKYVPEEPISFSTRDATPFLHGRPVVLSEVCYLMTSKQENINNLMDKSCMEY